MWIQVEGGSLINLDRVARIQVEVEYHAEWARLPENLVAVTYELYAYHCLHDYGQKDTLASFKTKEEAIAARDALLPLLNGGVLEKGIVNGT